MGELTRDDVGRAVHDALHDMNNEIARIRDAVIRVDHRTNDLNDSQREISALTRTMQQVIPSLDVLTRRAQQGSSEMQEHQRMRIDIDDVKQRVQNMERGVLQIVSYLQAWDKTAQEGQGSRRNRSSGY